MKRLLGLLNFRDENGATLVIVAISLVTLLGFTALTIDGGRLFSEKSQLQKALDAAVLAGAQGLRTSESWAKTIARDVSKKNGYSLPGESEVTVVGYRIKAEKEVQVSMTFARVLGINEANVHAKAEAIVAPLTKASGIAPIVISKSNIPDGTILNCGSTNPGDLQGNCGYLKSPDDNLRDAIKNGMTYEVGQTVSTDPGGAVGQVSQAINEIIARDASKEHCQSPDTADNTCERVITVVVIDDWVDVDGKEVTGKSELEVAGFAAYWIEKYEDKKLYGKFIKMIAPGEIGSGTGVGDFNLYGVKLVE